MNSHDLTRHYVQLTAQERFSLLLAAETRDDRQELRRLLDTAPRTPYSVPHHAPLLDAFLDLDKMHFMQLLETAACYLEAFPPPERKRRKGAGPLEDWSEVMLLGYLFRTYLEAWHLFCEELQVDPEFMWKAWPGYATVKRAERISGGNPDTGLPGPAYVREGVQRYFARQALGDDPELELDDAAWQQVQVITPESFAKELRRIWEHSLGKWGVAA
jgi:hypothetical protein